jgi:hypothetical protein
MPCRQQASELGGGSRRPGRESQQPQNGPGERFPGASVSSGAVAGPTSMRQRSAALAQFVQQWETGNQAPVDLRPRGQIPVLRTSAQKTTI